MLTEIPIKFVDRAHCLIQETIDLEHSPLPQQLIALLERDSQTCECAHRWLDALGPSGISEISKGAPGGAFDELVDMVSCYMQETHGYRAETVNKMYGKTK